MCKHGERVWGSTMDPGGSQSLGSPTERRGVGKWERKTTEEETNESGGGNRWRQTDGGGGGGALRAAARSASSHCGHQRAAAAANKAEDSCRATRVPAAGQLALRKQGREPPEPGPGRSPRQGHRGQTSPPPGRQERAGPQSNQPRGRVAAAGSPEASPGENERPESGCSGSLAPAWAQGQAWLPPTHKGSMKAAPGGAASPNR